MILYIFSFLFNQTHVKNNKKLFYFISYIFFFFHTLSNQTDLKKIILFYFSFLHFFSLVVYQVKETQKEKLQISKKLLLLSYKKNNQKVLQLRFM